MSVILLRLPNAHLCVQTPPRRGPGRHGSERSVLAPNTELELLYVVSGQCHPLYEHLIERWSQRQVPVAIAAESPASSHLTSVLFACHY